MATRQELIEAMSKRYQTVERRQKQRIIDEFLEVTGYHRKHAIRVLNGYGRAKGEKPERHQLGRRIYDEAVRQALLILWEASDRICGKRLKALLPNLLEALERHGHLQLDSKVRGRLVAMSAATIDRVLGPARQAIRGRGRRQASVGAAVRRSVPVRTFADWKDPRPGYFEMDLVAHCGHRVSGSFVHTLVLTDIASGWTECASLVVREQTLVSDAIAQVKGQLPFPLLGLDSDNDSAFLNETLLGFCQQHGVEWTRSRAYRKNDQAWVEQKNGAVVRRLVGYGRLEGLRAAEALSGLYEVARLYVNFFQPSFKLESKTREGARVLKRYHAPATPYERLLARQDLDQESKDRLRQRSASLDPLGLLKRIREAQQALASLEMGEGAEPADGRGGDLSQFLHSLSEAWREGEVRPTHRRRPTEPRTWRTRRDPFESVWPGLEAWLNERPETTAKALLQRLQQERPGLFPDGGLRTLQRRVKAWRGTMARRLLGGNNQLDPGTELTLV
jgi:hypothetical protein